MQLLIPLFLTLFLESITRCSPSGLWTSHTWATRLQDRAESVYFGALLAGLLLVPQHRSPPGIFPLKNYLITSNRHVLETCTAVEPKRVALGIREFLEAGRSRATAYKSYILGLNKNGHQVDPSLHLKRGSCLQELTDTWLSTWEIPLDIV